MVEEEKSYRSKLFRRRVDETTSLHIFIECSGLNLTSSAAYYGPLRGMRYFMVELGEKCLATVQGMTWAFVHGVPDWFSVDHP